MNIHRILIIASILLSGHLLSAKDERGFPDLKSLEEFAKSSWGGGEIDHLKNGKDQIVVVRKQFTSGVISCILSIYTKDKGRWISAIEMNPVSMKYMSFEQNGDAVKFYYEDSKKEVFSVSISELSDWNSTK